MKSSSIRLVLPALVLIISCFISFLVKMIGDEASAIRNDYDSFYYKDLSGSTFSREIPDEAIDKLNSVESNLDILVDHFSFLLTINLVLTALTIVLVILRIRDKAGN